MSEGVDRSGTQLSCDPTREKRQKKPTRRNKTVLAEGVVCMREGEHVRALFVTEGINTLTQ